MLNENRFRQVLLAAGETVYYRRRLRAAGHPGEALAAPSETPEQAMANLPRVELRELLDRPLAFHNPTAPRRRLRQVHYPAGRAPRIVTLMPGFRQPAGVRVTACGWTWLLPRFRPTGVAAPVARLRELARAIETGEAPPPRLDHAVIAFTGVHYGLITDEDRDLFWRAYRVPLFEQLVGLGDEVLAWECEAHVGLHIVPENLLLEMSSSWPEPELLFTSLDCVEFPALRVATGFTATVDRNACACGMSTPRLLGLRRRAQAKPRAFAAAAG
jgi:hypothetical protein